MFLSYIEPVDDLPLSLCEQPDGLIIKGRRIAEVVKTHSDQPKPYPADIHSPARSLSKETKDLLKRTSDKH